MRFRLIFSLLLLSLGLLPSTGSADGFLARRGALVQPSGDGNDRVVGTGPSLFAGTSRGGLFEPMAARPRVTRAGALRPWTGPGSDARIVVGPLGGAPDVMAIRHIIGQAEAGRDGYDAVVWSARIKPPLPPTRMTLKQIFHWIRDTPGQNHAIGRYQFIPSTLARLVTALDLGPEVIFTPAVQDRLADLLLAEAGLLEARAGRIGRHTFMNNLAKIWAGLPTSSGRSHYHGYAGNKATTNWRQVDAALSRHFPRQG